MEKNSRFETDNFVINTYDDEYVHIMSKTDMFEISFNTHKEAEKWIKENIG